MEKSYKMQQRCLIWCLSILYFLSKDFCLLSTKVNAENVLMLCQLLHLAGIGGLFWNQPLLDESSVWSYLETLY
jgi:hypothetical protein